MRKVQMKGEKMPKRKKMTGKVQKKRRKRQMQKKKKTMRKGQTKN